MGPTSNGREQNGKGEGSGKKGKGERGRGLETPPLHISGYTTARSCYVDDMKVVVEKRQLT